MGSTATRKGGAGTDHKKATGGTEKKKKKKQRRGEVRIHARLRMGTSSCAAMAPSTGRQITFTHPTPPQTCEPHSRVEHWPCADTFSPQMDFLNKVRRRLIQYPQCLTHAYLPRPRTLPRASRARRCSASSLVRRSSSQIRRARADCPTIVQEATRGPTRATSPPRTSRRARTRTGAST